jgi:uncharacterized protein
VIIAMTGASGFLGRAASERLRAAGHEVRPVKLRDGGPLPECDAVVHLAGEPVAQRWTPEVKQRILESRVEGTRRVAAEAARLHRAPLTFLCGSAIGIYGSRGDEILTEASAPGSGFLADVCVQWEKAADEALALGTRVVKLRTGVVLGPGGGALARMLTPFRLGAGGRLGSGRQWMSWIHVDDLVGLIEFALGETKVTGPVNGTAPNPVTNAQFTRQLAGTLHRPAILPAPAFALKLAFGEMASVLLDSQRVLPRAALDRGYRFRYPELIPALRSVVA